MTDSAWGQLRGASVRGRAVAMTLVASVGWLVLTACGGTSPYQPAPSQPQSATSGVVSTGSVGVAVQNFMFTPQNVTIPVGATVTWTFPDAIQHTVTADDASFDSGILSGGKRTPRPSTRPARSPTTAPFIPR